MLPRLIRLTIPAFALWSLAGAVPAAACSIPPTAPYDNVHALIQRSKTIVLGDVVSLNIRDGWRDYREYTVRTIDIVKGHSAPTFILRREPVAAPSPEVDRKLIELFEQRPAQMADHTRLEFWLGDSGSGWITPMCGVDSLLHRGRHLFFLDQSHVRGSEPIISDDDLWYATVRSMVRDPSLKGRMISPAQFLSMFYSVYLYECGVYGFPLYWRSQRVAGHYLAPWSHDDRSTRLYPTGCGKGVSHYIAMFQRPGDDARRTAPVRNGKVTFSERYGDLVLAPREVFLADIAASGR